MAAVVDVLDGGLMAQPRIAQPPRQLLVITIANLAVEQETEPFGLGRAGLRRSWSRRRVPAARGLPDPPHRDAQAGGADAIPARTPWCSRGAWARRAAGQRAAQAGGDARGRGAKHRRAFSPRLERLMPPRQAGPRICVPSLPQFGAIAASRSATKAGRRPWNANSSPSVSCSRWAPGIWSRVAAASSGPTKWPTCSGCACSTTISPIPRTSISRRIGKRRSSALRAEPASGRGHDPRLS